MVAKLNAPLVVIVGPTASGKSKLAMVVAKKYGGEIICADSRTTYRGMDIGTAKPSRSDQAKISHHLLDIVDPGEPFTVADFKRLAASAIKDISSRNKLPILVGGSGLYIDSVIFDFRFANAAKPGVRRQLNGLNVEQLQNICRQKDIELPENFKNKRYLIRAIEVGGVIKQNKALRPNTIVVGISTDKEELEENIKKRAQAMVRAGIVNEVRRLGKTYGWNNEAMKGNIYRVFRSVVEDDMPLDIALNEIVQSDIKLVKKQLTWLKRNPFIKWVSSDEVMAEIDKFMYSASKAKH